jgi:hypothetical protein
MNYNIGKALIIIGLIIAAAGVIIFLRDSIPLLRHIGKLPGDIQVRRENFSFYFPITTSILLSIIISLIFFLVNRFRG